MPPPPDSEDLSVTEVERIDEVCVRFEDEWKAGRKPSLEAFLDGFSGPARRSLLGHLLKLELKYKGGGDLDEYVRRFREESDLIRSLLAGCFAPGRVLGGYELIGVLGRGGMGVVYRARRVADGLVVALKVPRDPDDLYHFNREFRALQSVRHDNLVRLYDCGQEGDVRFFTMELVECDLLSHVRRHDLAPAAPDGDSSADTQIVDPFSPATLGRIREAMRQLALGLHELHQRGKMHADVKPSNVRVQPDGRVVLLDFGLVRGTESASRTGMAGTDDWMAPEQAEGQPVVASDWYSFGVLLYEALTNRHPFRETPHRRPWNRRGHAPPAPRSLIPAIPSDLDALCLELLQPAPCDRPAGAEVLRRLGAKAPPPPPDDVFVGRESEMGRLRSAFEAVAPGRAVVVRVAGQSGIGKSALVRHFLAELRGQRSVLILTGRCYERETVRCKAFDSLLDSLASSLRKEEDARVFLPYDVGALVRAFPQLNGVPAIAATEAPIPLAVDPQEQRRRGYAALRELLLRLSARQPLVLAVDDLQWADAESILLLDDLLQPPTPPRLLLVASYRSEDAPSSEFLRELQKTSEKVQAGVEWRDLPVGSLSQAEALVLAGRLLGASSDCAADVVREADGSPFLLQELAHVGRMTGGPITRAELIRVRGERLSDEQRTLLAVVAISGRPLGGRDAYLAADLPPDNDEALRRLQAEQLVRAAGQPGRLEVETYHDRIREAVVAAIPDDRRKELHRSLAEVLMRKKEGDPEEVALHAEAGGLSERAADFYERAADDASKELAFERAALLYGKSLALGSAAEEKARSLRERRGNALANAGCGQEAAREYLRAAEGAPADRAFDLRRRAAEHFLCSGHVDPGQAALRVLLDEVGLRWPGSTWRVVASLRLRRLWLRLRGFGAVVAACKHEPKGLRRLWLRLRGFGFRLRGADQIPADQLRRIDACWTGGHLTFVDMLRALDFQGRHLLLALSAGEPSQISLGLAKHAPSCVYQSARGEALAERLLETAKKLARQCGHAHALGYALLGGGIVAFMTGKWQVALDRLEEGEQVLRQGCTSAAWELGSIQHFRLSALTLMGRWGEMARCLPADVEEARRRGDRNSEALLHIHEATSLLGADRSDLARQRLDTAVELWDQSHFNVIRYLYEKGQCEASLYGGEVERAWRQAEELASRLRRSSLSNSQTLRIGALSLRWRGALAAGATGDASAALAGLRREGVGYADALADLGGAGVALARGRHAEAAAAFAKAEETCCQAGLGLHATVARRRRGELLGDKSLIAEADAWMARELIRNPARIADLLAPLPGGRTKIEKR